MPTFAPIRADLRIWLVLRSVFFDCQRAHPRKETSPQMLHAGFLFLCSGGWGQASAATPGCWTCTGERSTKKTNKVYTSTKVRAKFRQNSIQKKKKVGERWWICLTPCGSDDIPRARPGPPRATTENLRARVSFVLYEFDVNLAKLLFWIICCSKLSCHRVAVGRTAASLDPGGSHQPNSSNGKAMIGPTS